MISYEYDNVPKYDISRHSPSFGKKLCSASIDGRLRRPQLRFFVHPHLGAISEPDHLHEITAIADEVVERFKTIGDVDAHLVATAVWSDNNSPLHCL